MTISNKPRAVTNEAGFVAGAPDAAKSRLQRRKKTQITSPISPELLAKIGEAAAKRYVTRVALIAMWLGDRLFQEERVE